MQLEYQTAQFPNSFAGQKLKNEALARAVANGWKVESETLLPGHMKGEQACCLALICLPLGFLAGRTEGVVSVTCSRPIQPNGNTAPPPLPALPAQTALDLTCLNCGYVNSPGRTICKGCGSRSEGRAGARHAPVRRQPVPRALALPPPLRTLVLCERAPVRRLCTLHGAAHRDRPIPACGAARGRIPRPRRVRRAGGAGDRRRDPARGVARVDESAEARDRAGGGADGARRAARRAPDVTPPRSNGPGPRMCEGLGPFSVLASRSE